MVSTLWAEYSAPTIKRRKKEIFLPYIHNLHLKENDSTNISDFWKASDNFSKVLWLLILPQYCATKALPRMGQFRCHEVYCLIFPEGTKQHSDIFLFSFCSKDNAEIVIYFGKIMCFKGKRCGNLYVTGYCFIFFPHWDIFGISDIFPASVAKKMRTIVILFGKRLFLGKRWGNLYVTGYRLIFFPHWEAITF